MWGKHAMKQYVLSFFVDGWKLEVETDETGKCFQKESFGGQEKMEEKKDQVYLGDVISSNGTHQKNVQARKNKGLGIITQIMQILQSTFFGKYYFEVALVLRSSLLLYSLKPISCLGLTNNVRITKFSS